MRCWHYTIYGYTNCGDARILDLDPGGVASGCRCPSCYDNQLRYKMVCHSIKIQLVNRRNLTTMLRVVSKEVGFGSLEAYGGWGITGFTATETYSNYTVLGICPYYVACDNMVAKPKKWIYFCYMVISFIRCAFESTAQPDCVFDSSVI